MTATTFPGRHKIFPKREVAEHACDTIADACKAVVRNCDSQEGVSSAHVLGALAIGMSFSVRRIASLIAPGGCERDLERQMVELISMHLAMTSKSSPTDNQIAFATHLYDCIAAARSCGVGAADVINVLTRAISDVVRESDTQETLQ